MSSLNLSALHLPRRSYPTRPPQSYCSPPLEPESFNKYINIPELVPGVARGILKRALVRRLFRWFYAWMLEGSIC